MYDVEGLIFKEQLRKDGLVDLDPHRLVYKQYKIKDDLKSAGESIQSLTFRDAYMQHLSSVYAKEFNKNITRRQRRAMGKGGSRSSEARGRATASTTRAARCTCTHIF